MPPCYRSKVSPLHGRIRRQDNSPLCKPQRVGVPRRDQQRANSCSSRVPRDPPALCVPPMEPTLPQLAVSTKKKKKKKTQAGDGDEHRKATMKKRSIVYKAPFF